MIRIWRIDSISRVFIYGVTEGPADSFSAGSSGDFIFVMRKEIGIMEVGNAHFSTIGDYNGNSFASVSAALDYLNMIFQAVVPPAANAVEKLFTYDEPISALQCVYASDEMGSVSIADPSEYTTARVLGVALTSGAMGDTGMIRLFGRLDDPSFQFPVEADLFLAPSGAITNVAPTESADTGTSTRVGSSLGYGSIFITVDKPVEF